MSLYPYINQPISIVVTDSMPVSLYPSSSWGLGVSTSDSGGVGSGSGVLVFLLKSDIPLGLVWIVGSSSWGLGVSTSDSGGVGSGSGS